MSQLTRLREEASRFDDDALVHLGNRGLVKRASKLLATGQPEIVEESSAVVVRSLDWGVRFVDDAVVSDGQCDCSTAGACQHLIASILLLQQGADLSSDTAAPHAKPGQAKSSLDPAVNVDPGVEGDVKFGNSILQSLLAIDDSQWKKLTNAAGRRWAMARADSLDLSRLEVEFGNGLTVRLPPPLGPVRFMTADPTSAIIKPVTANDDRLIAYAILCLRSRAGLALPEVATLVRAVELPTERLSVAKRSVVLAGDGMRIGLSHLGTTDQERFDSLAASARGAKLYRLALVAERASDQIQVMTQRSAEADPQRLFSLVSELYVLGSLIGDVGKRGGSVPDHLAGRARAQFETIGSLRLAGVGHFTWGGADFGGITGVFADVDNGAFYSLSKPLTIGGRRQSEAVGWQNVGAIESLSGKELNLAGAAASETSRLSSSPRSVANLGGAFDASVLNTVTWNGQAPPMPSRLKGTQAGQWVAVEVATGSAFAYDEVTQSLLWPIESRDVEVSVKLQYGTHTIASINRLEQLVPMSPTLVIGRMDRSPDGLTLFPVSVVASGKLEVLSGGVSTTTAEQSGDDAAPMRTPSHVDRVSMKLLALAERGTAGPIAEKLQAVAGEADRWGLVAVVDTIAAAPGPTDALLRGCWVADEYLRLT